MLNLVVFFRWTGVLSRVEPGLKGFKYVIARFRNSSAFVRGHMVDLCHVEGNLSQNFALLEKTKRKVGDTIQQCLSNGSPIDSWRELAVDVVHSQSIGRPRDPRRSCSSEGICTYRTGPLPRRNRRPIIFLESSSRTLVCLCAIPRSSVIAVPERSTCQHSGSNSMSRRKHLPIPPPESMPLHPS